MSTLLGPVIGTIRAPFRVLTPACVLLGVATAANAQGAIAASPAGRAAIALRMNVVVCVLTPVLVAAGMLLS